MEYLEQLRQKGWDINYIDTIYDKDQWYSVRTYTP
jgi:hypothetical protein